MLQQTPWDQHRCSPLKSATSAGDSASFDFFVLAGDGNRDRRVNLADFNVLAANFGQSGRNFSQGNFDYDPAGMVNLRDFNILASQFGASVSPQIQGVSIWQAAQTSPGGSRVGDTFEDDELARAPS